MEIVLSNGMITLVDEIDYYDLAWMNWYARKENQSYYVSRTVHNRTIYMHQIIVERMKLGPGMIDHKDRDGLNNQRSNLRIATRSQNNANSKFRTNNKTGYRGVCWYKSARKYMATIRINSNAIYLGLYDTAEEAHEVYKKKYIETRGEFANLDGFIGE